MSDLISRRAAIKAIDDLPNCYNGYSDTYDKAYIIGVLEEVPGVEPKKGRWSWGNCEEDFICSECGKTTRVYRDELVREIDEERYMVFLEPPNWCCYCGADMRGKSCGTS